MGLNAGRDARRLEHQVVEKQQSSMMGISMEDQVAQGDQPRILLSDYSEDSLRSTLL